MVGNLESLGDAVTGGIVSRAVEPKAGEIGPDGLTQETKCLNCGAELAGPFCHECGQHAHVHRTLTSFFHDFLHGVLHFEGKIWRTLPMLLWRPGELTRRYIDGQRARFVSPIALFLFCVFLTFAIMGLTGSLDAMASEPSTKGPSNGVQKADLAVKKLQAARAASVKAGQPTEDIDDELEEARDALEEAQSEQKELKVEAFNAGTLEKRNIERKTINIRNNGVPGWIGKFVSKAGKNPELLFYKIKTNAYKFSWALIPISVPFVWLLFPFSRRFRLYDHTVFVTYSICFMMLLLTVGTTIGLVFPTIATLLFFVPPFHMYRQLKGAYGLARWGALWRTTLLVGFSFAAIGMFTSLIVGLGEA
jgi:hypothetical protein